YRRNDLEFARTHFRVRGDEVEIFPANKSEIALRVEFFGHEIDRICEIEALTGKVKSELKHAAIFPASHFSVEQQRLQEELRKIELDKQAQVEYFKQRNKLIEAQRINERVNYDLEMLREMGYCNGIENYSRYFDGREPGEPPFTLLDYFPKDFI